LVGIGALVVLAAGGGGGYAIWRVSSGGSGPTKVGDSQLSVKVPKDWSGQYKSGPWKLDAFGAKNQEGHGIEVSDNVAKWRTIDSTTPGVFVGVSSQLSGKSLTAMLAAVSHPGCTSSTPTGLPGTSKQWSCPGNVVLTDNVRKMGGNLVYVQVKRQQADKNETKAIVDSVVVDS
jgi:hypothetical protein